jgi:dipeptidyl aminopeptidase/acylaminoacyl peptidase
MPTRDGKSIPGYVTMLPGPTTNRPTVIMPHGGPSSRDEWGFDWLAQFLASQGYVVIQPNYRGSAGYGDDFLGENAFKGWKLAMSDIADAADWAVNSGLADPKRMAIVGWSYGGYAALQSAALDPRYKSVVAIAPVADLGALRRDAEGFSNADIAKDMIGKGPHLREGSPYYNAASIKAPVLLVHGELDSNVRIAHSQRMERALRKAGTPVEFLQYKPLDHYLDDSEARVEMLMKMGQLLDRTIGQ